MVPQFLVPLGRKSPILPYLLIAVIPIVVVDGVAAVNHVTQMSNKRLFNSYDLGHSLYVRLIQKGSIQKTILHVGNTSRSLATSSSVTMVSFKCSSFKSDKRATGDQSFTAIPPR